MASVIGPNWPLHPEWRSRLALRGTSRIPIDLRQFGGSVPLTSDVIDVPKSRTDQEMTQSIPVTYVPARNTIFLSLALAWAEVLGASSIVIGVNAIDYSGYPDCRPEFISSFETMAIFATRGGVDGLRYLKINTRLIDLSKAGIIRLATG